jgi:Na+(H+)/acetate symporter ActP
MASPIRKKTALDRLNYQLSRFTALFLRVAEAGFALVAIIVLIYILLGEVSGTFVISVIANIVLLTGAVTPEALVGIAIVLGLVYMIKNGNRSS